MKNKTFGWLLIGGVSLWYFILRGVRGLKWRIADWRLQTLSAEEVSLMFFFQLKNSLFISVPIDKLEGDIYAQEVLLGYVDMPVSVNVRANSISEIPITLSLNYRKVGEAVWRNIMSGDIRTIKIRFKGRVYSGLRSISIDKVMYYNDIFY